MKRQGTFNLSRLNEELLTALPDLIRTYGPDNRREALYSLAVPADLSGIEIFLVSDAPYDEADIDAVLQNHDPSAKSASEIEQEARTTLKGQIIAVAQSAEGKRWQDTTAGEKQALQLVALYKLGVLDSSGRVRPLNEILSD